MILFPAIDLKDGQCVRLVWQAAGFEWLHVVDLNGAFDGRSTNRPAVEAILRAIAIPMQLGGGIRDRAAIDAWLSHGVARVILGTVALRDPDLVKDAARAHPGRIAVGIDAKAGMVAVEGWAETSSVTARDLAKRFEDAGVAAIIYTDIARDGTGAGLNIAATLELAQAVDIPVIASGGLAGIDDLRAVKMTRGLIAGAICGRALYDGRLNPQEALALARS